MDWLALRGLLKRRDGNSIARKRAGNLGMNRLACAEIFGPVRFVLQCFRGTYIADRIESQHLPAICLQRKRAGRAADRAACGGGVCFGVSFLRAARIHCRSLFRTLGVGRAGATGIDQGPAPLLYVQRGRRRRMILGLRESRSARQREHGKQPCKFFHESSLRASSEHFCILDPMCGQGPVRNLTVTLTASLPAAPAAVHKLTAIMIFWTTCQHGFPPGETRPP